MAIPELKIAAWQFLELADWNIQWPIRPFWRLYWNDAPGATLSCDNETFLLEPEHIVVLPPYSFFSSQLARPVKHFFIHFMTGARFADLERRVTALPTPEMLHTIIRSDDPAERQELRLFALLFEVLADLPHGGEQLCPSLPQVRRNHAAAISEPFADGPGEDAAAFERTLHQ